MQISLSDLMAYTEWERRKWYQCLRQHGETVLRISDPASIPNDNIEAIFEFSQRSRKELRNLIETLPASEWDTPADYKILNYHVKATPRKIVTHVLLHEIRHWAQTATVLRLNGVVDEFHDFLGSPVMGGEWKREEAQK